MGMYGMPERNGTLGVRGASVAVRMQDKFECDQVRFSVTVAGQGNDAPKAKAAYQDTRNTIVLAIRDLGVKGKDITETPITIRPHIDTLYERYEPKDSDTIIEDLRVQRPLTERLIGRSGASLQGEYYRAVAVLTGYEYEFALFIAVDRKRNIHEQIHEYLTGLQGELGNDISVTFSMHYDVADHNAAQKALMQAAVLKSRLEAEALAKAAGERISEVQEIVYQTKASGNGEGAAIYMDMVGADNAPDRGYTVGYTDISSSLMTSRKQQVPDFNPAPVTIDCDVSTIWKFAN